MYPFLYFNIINKNKNKKSKNKLICKKKKINYLAIFLLAVRPVSIFLRLKKNLLEADY